jgi:predicted phosphodiesterase
MKVRLISDLHLDHLKITQQNALVQTLREACTEPCDVLFFAGDLYDGSSANKFLPELEEYRKHCNAKLCVAVQGNHDFWRTEMTPQYIIGGRKCLRYENSVLLENSKVILRVGDEILRVYGGTGWFPPTVKAHTRKASWVDFHEIAKFDPFEQNRVFKQRLVQESTPPDIVISHHIPLAELQDSKYRNGPDSCFFVGDLLDNHTPIPQVWMYGHTHSIKDETMHQCRFLCNPHGYPFERYVGDYVPYKPMELNVQTFPLQRFEAVDVQA